MVDFLFIIIELFRYLLWLRRYKRKSVEVGVFKREVQPQCGVQKKNVERKMWSKIYMFSLKKMKN